MLFKFEISRAFSPFQYQNVWETRNIHFRFSAPSSGYKQESCCETYVFLYISLNAGYGLNNYMVGACKHNKQTLCWSWTWFEIKINYIFFLLTPISKIKNFIEMFPGFCFYSHFIVRFSSDIGINN